MVDEPEAHDDQVLFALSPPASQKDGIPLLAFVIPEGAWNVMLDGRSHDFDLSVIGIPLKVIIGRSTDHLGGLKMLEAANGGPLHDFLDYRDVDVGIKDRGDEKPH